jgi:DNA-binding transcriptional LysR family regulator
MIRFNLNQLKVFYLAAKYKNFTIAAQLLNVTQPAVSLQIKSLEKFYGIRLFNKVGRQLVLTDAGEILYQYAEKIFAMTTEMVQTLNDLKHMKYGTLKVGTTSTFAHHFMPDLIANYQKFYPEIRIILYEGSSSDILQTVLDKKNELGIVGRLPYPADIQAMPLLDQELCLVASPQYPGIQDKKAGISVKELPAFPIIFREMGSSIRYVITNFCETHRITPNVRIESGSLAFIKDLVIQGHGLSFFTRAAVSNDIQNHHLLAIPILEGNPLLNIDIIFRKKSLFSHAARAFMDIIEAEKRDGAFKGFHCTDPTMKTERGKIDDKNGNHPKNSG